jgi:F-type H+-transporting ATPase subunit delta
MARQKTKPSPAAAAYARALLELAVEQKTAEPIGAELKSLADAVASDGSFEAFLRDPSIPSPDKFKVLDAAMAQAHQTLRNFVAVMARHDRLALLSETAGAYADLLDKHLGRVDVEMTVARPLDDAQAEQIRQRVSQALGRTAVIHAGVDESIIGGLILRVQDQLIDASVRAQLQSMRNRLLASRPQ